MSMCNKCRKKDQEIETLSHEIERLEEVRKKTMSDFNDLLIVYRKAINNPDFGILY